MFVLIMSQFIKEVVSSKEYAINLDMIILSFVFTII